MKTIWLLLLSGIAIASWAQPKPIQLVNPSFEDLHGAAKTPYGWFFCGPAEESAPDVQPGHFSVSKKPADGASYVGMVTRDNESWECLGQRLKQPLRTGQCYHFSVALAQADAYPSVSRITWQADDYRAPTKLRIWGSHQLCERDALLAQTTAIQHTDWQWYTLAFQPKVDYQYLLLEAYYGQDEHPNTMGHLLVDAAGPIFPIHCDSGELMGDFLAMPEIKNPDQQTVYAALQQLAWTADGSPKTSLYRTKEGDIRPLNRPLYQLAAYLNQATNQKLEIAIPKPVDEAWWRRSNGLVQMLKKYGISEARILIRKSKKKDTRTDWIIGPPTQPVYLRVVE